MITSTLSSTQKLREWVQSEKANGLIDIKFFKANTENSTVESFASEVLEMLTSQDVDDPDFI